VQLQDSGNPPAARQDTGAAAACSCSIFPMLQVMNVFEKRLARTERLERLEGPKFACIERP
jgi:hypothetical protein